MSAENATSKRKFSEPLSDGRKHFVVSGSRWGRDWERVVVAKSAADARYIALPRRGVAEYVSKVRRATPGEAEAAQ